MNAHPDDIKLAKELVSNREKYYALVEEFERRGCSAFYGIPDYVDPIVSLLTRARNRKSALSKLTPEEREALDDC